MKDINKDFLAGFVIACFVSIFFYYTSQGCAFNMVDVYWVEFGMIMPFILPLFFLFKIIKARPRRLM
jgi:hypothetical protein